MTSSDEDTTSPHLEQHLPENRLQYLRNEFNFQNVHGIMNTSGLLRSSKGTFQETRGIHDSMNIPKIEFIAYRSISL